MKPKLVLIVCAALLVCAGCGNAHPSASRQLRTNQSGNQVEASRAKTYQTMSELRKDSMAVLRVTATANRKSTAADQAGQGPLQAVLTTVHVDKVISGSLATGYGSDSSAQQPGRALRGPSTAARRGAGVLPLRNAL